MRVKKGLTIMNGKTMLTWCFVLAFACTAVFVGPRRVFAHCDGIDGPVVRAAQAALNTGDVNLVLIWVQETDEAEVAGAFQQARAVRTLNREAQQLADRYFFETLVRLHRAGEGAPYTGLKPAGRDLGPAIPAADGALEKGSAERLLTLLSAAVQDGVREQFRHVVASKNFNTDDVRAGQAYVKAYVEFVHYVARIYEAATHPSPGHFPEAGRDIFHQQ